MRYFKDLYLNTFVLLKDNMVLAQPLILFFIASGLIMMPVNNVNNIRNMAVVFVCICLVSVVFNSGWYSMFHKCVTTPLNPHLTKHEQALKSLELFKEFFPGVGQYFFQILIGSVIYIAIMAAIFLICYEIGIYYIGIPANINWEKIFAADQTTETLKTYFNSLPMTVKNQIALWELLILIGVFICYVFNYLVMFWAQSIVFFKVNPFKGYLNSLKLIIKHPVQTFVIALSSAFCLNVAFLIASIPFILLQFLGLFLYILVLVYFNLILFVYFDKQSLGNNSRADCFR